MGAHAQGSDFYPLTERIVDLLRDNGAISVSELPKWLKLYDEIDIDTAVSGLLRGNRISRAFGRYELGEGSAAPTPPSAPRGKPVTVTVQPPAKRSPPPVATTPVPTADEEAASALNPNERRCKGKCGLVQPLTRQFFHRHNGFKDGWDSRCKKCREAGRTPRDRSPATQSGPEPGLPSEARHSAASVYDRDEAPRGTAPASDAVQQASPTVADDTAERRSGRGDEKTEPQARSPEPEKGDRQSTETALGKASPAQPTEQQDGPRAEPPVVVDPEQFVLMRARDRAVAANHKVAEKRSQILRLVSEIEALETEIGELEQFVGLYEKFACGGGGTA